MIPLFLCQVIKVDEGQSVQVKVKGKRVAFRYVCVFANKSCQSLIQSVS